MFRNLFGKSHTITIKTARNQKEINKAVRKGYWPLIKEVKPSDEIRTKYIIHQNKTTGEIEIVGDYRRKPSTGYEYVMTVWDYPYHFESPFAAYLIPKNLKEGEEVFLEDLIEDHVDWCWNQGDATRLKSCKAIWTGEDFNILYKKEDYPCVIG